MSIGEVYREIVRGILLNAGLGTAATKDTGTGDGQISPVVSKGSGRHVSSLFLEELSNYNMDGEQVYMIVGVATGTTGLLPIGMVGRIHMSRGGTSSSNFPGIVDVVCQQSYKDTQPMIRLQYMQGSRAIFRRIVSATYAGNTIYALELTPTGGGLNNGAFFSGVVFNDNELRNIFKIVKATDITNILDISGTNALIQYPVLGTTGYTVGESVGNVMVVGNVGVGKTGVNTPTDDRSGFISASSVADWIPLHGAGWQSSYANNRLAQLWMLATGELVARWSDTGPTASKETKPWRTIYTTGNTTKGSDGTLKAASPIVKIFHDGKSETNDESEGCAVKRIDVGQYLIENCIGLNADATWGGINGGFDIPKDRNSQALIWLVYEVNADGSVLVKTYHRTYPNSPVFARNDIEGLVDGDPVDIPADQFVSVRVEMPVDSTWNQKQATIQADSETLQPENQEE